MKKNENIVVFYRKYSCVLQKKIVVHPIMIFPFKSYFFIKVAFVYFPAMNGGVFNIIKQSKFEHNMLVKTV